MFPRVLIIVPHPTNQGGKYTIRQHPSESSEKRKNSAAPVLLMSEDPV